MTMIDPETTRACELLRDAAGVSHEFSRLVHDNAVVHQLMRIAEREDWDDVRALKSIILVLAAGMKDLGARCQQSPSLSNRPIIFDPRSGD